MVSPLKIACERDIDLGLGQKYRFFSMRALQDMGAGNISRLPVSLRIVLESLVRNCDDQRVSEQQVRDLAAAGENMPPKSTFFYPKLLTGLLFNPLA